MISLHSMCPDHVLATCQPHSPSEKGAALPGPARNSDTTPAMDFKPGSAAPASVTASCETQLQLRMCFVSNVMERVAKPKARPATEGEACAEGEVASGSGLRTIPGMGAPSTKDVVMLSKVFQSGCVHICQWRAHASRLGALDLGPVDRETSGAWYRAWHPCGWNCSRAWLTLSWSLTQQQSACAACLAVAPSSSGGRIQ